MKPFLFLLSLLIAAIPANAAMRERRAAPVLHSVFDAKPAQSPLTDAMFLNPHEPAAPFFGPRHFDPDKAARRREGGIYMMVFGAIALAGATAIIMTAARTTSQNSIDYYSAGWHLILGALVACVGLGLFVPGIIMLLHYSRKRSWY